VASANQRLWTLATTPSTTIIPDAVIGLKRPVRRSMVTAVTRNRADRPPSALQGQRRHSGCHMIITAGDKDEIEGARPDIPGPGLTPSYAAGGPTMLEQQQRLRQRT